MEVYMRIRIVADSSADLLSYDGVEFASAPLRILTDTKEYIDDENLDVMQFVKEMRDNKGKSSTACPGVGDYISAFDGADWVFVVTISSNLSGSYNSAMVAKNQYISDYPNKKVYVIDSLSAGPEMAMIVEKLAELINEGKEFEEIANAIDKYKERTKLAFALKSLLNLARNGRVSKSVATVAGIMNIRLVGIASEEGTLQPIDKVRGEKKSVLSIIENMKKLGYTNGKVRITHCNNEEIAKAIKSKIMEFVPNVDIKISHCRGLCSFYAEDGGTLIGFEV
ncbi:MAG: DegV family protein [Lachnospiraceae bacterium]|nr:DegV family protein [Lachnospiraceae bacterium]